MLCSFQGCNFSCLTGKTTCFKHRAHQQQLPVPQQQHQQQHQQLLQHQPQLLVPQRQDQDQDQDQHLHQPVPQHQHQQVHQMQSNGYIVLHTSRAENLIGEIGNVQREYNNGCKIYFKFLSFLKENGTTLMVEDDDENNHDECYDEQCNYDRYPIIFNKSTLNINIYKFIETQLNDKLNDSFVIKINDPLNNNIQFVEEFIEKFEEYMTPDNSWCDMHDLLGLKQLKYGNNDIYVAEFDPENG